MYSLPTGIELSIIPLITIVKKAKKIDHMNWNLLPLKRWIIQNIASINETSIKKEQKISMETLYARALYVIPYSVKLEKVLI